MRTKLCIAAALAALAFGCTPKAPDTDVAKLTPQSPPETKPTPPPPVPPKTDLDRNKIPAALAGDAYHYYGLSSSKPIRLKMTQQPLGTITTGTLTNRLVKVKGDRAEFVADSTGDISQLLGNSNVELRPDGVYELTSAKITVNAPVLTLPNHLTTGKTWTNDTKLEMSGQTFHQHLDFVCRGVKSIKSGGKTYSALCVEGNGRFIENSPAADAGVAKKAKAKPTVKVQKIDEKLWYVKDIGLVRFEIMQTQKGQKPVSLVMQLDSDQGDAKP